ncbi:MAG TPA: DUF2270 domain-containing protein [Pyrinomonadaceae bacterium]|jgi:uncharacterized membrane protein
MSIESRTRGSGSLTGSERVSGQLHTTTTPDRLHATVTPERAPVDRTDGAARQFIPTRKLSTAEFNTAMVHFYRGEVQRSNTWRNRLDTTTNWAVLTAGATLSFVFSSPSNPHFVIPINSILVAIFLLMEARRYRYYEIWSSRVRVMETGYFAQMLAPDGVVDQEWADHLAADLLTPHFTISEWEAIGRRLRRNYLWIFALLALSWNLKVYLHPLPAYSFNVFIERATVGLVPGWIVFFVGVVFNVSVIVFAIATVRLREATGEVLPRHKFSLRPLQRMTDWTRGAAASARNVSSRRAKRARQRTRTATGEFRKLDISEVPNKEPMTK